MTSLALLYTDEKQKSLALLQRWKSDIFVLEKLFLLNFDVFLRYTASLMYPIGLTDTLWFLSRVKPSKQDVFEKALEMS